MEEQAQDALASILLVEGDRLLHGGAPSLPEAYTEAIDGVLIGPNVGSCGTAAYTGKQVIVSDIASDPLWADYREAALPHSLRACWSTPIFSSEGKAIGTFAMYYREPRGPSQRDQEMIEQITHLAGVTIQRKLSEEALRKSERQFRALFDQAAVGITLVSRARRVFESNRKIQEMLGYSAEELRHLRSETVTHPDDLELDQKLFAELVSGRRDHYQIEKRYYRKDGDLVWANLTVSFVRNDRGEPLFGIGIIEDITERKRAEQELRASEERFRTLLQFSFDVYWETDAQHRFIRQEFAESLADAPAPGSEIGKTCWEVPYLEPDAEAWRKHRETLDAHLPFRDFELARPTPDGGKRYVSVSGLAVFDETGRFIGYRGVGRHITERKQAEQALHRAQTELAHVTRVMAMGELTSSIAHEVNQPLAAIVTSSNACLRWLAKQPPNLDEARECLRRMIRDSNRAGEVITRIRSLVKKSSPLKARLDLNDAIKEVLAIIDPEARRHVVLVRTELAASLPPVRGDRVQLQQVILNLVMNGIEAMKEVADRPRELRIRSRPHEAGTVLVTVQDNGIGLQAESLERVFEAFYTTKAEGMGMGLSISRTIIEAHGGRLWANPNDGPGATFQFTLPAGGARVS